MKLLSTEITNLVKFDLLNTNLADHYNIYEKQKKIENFSDFCATTIGLSTFFYVYYLGNLSVDLKEINSWLIKIFIILFFAGISTFVISHIPLLYNKKIFSMDKKIKSLKKTIITIIDSENHTPKLKKEARQLLKIINNEKEIKKIINKTEELEPFKFKQYFEVEPENPNKNEPPSIIEDKSMIIDRNLELIRKQIKTKQL